MNKTLLKAVAACVLITGAVFAQAPPFTGFTPGNLVVSRSVYTGDATTVTIGQALPPICPATAACGTVKATDSGAFPSTGSTNNVWNNDKQDGSFGVTSPIFLDQLSLSGGYINTLAFPSSMLTTSFSSKSELALNLSVDGTAITFMGYNAAPNTVDVSNSNTPGVNDPTNPVGTSYYRSVAQVSATGAVTVTPTNAYSGNNGRAAILSNGQYYLVGNSNNGTGTPTNVITATGVQIATPGQTATTVPQQIGNFSITQVTDPATGKPYAADKLGKDNNFRGLTIFNNTLYVTKGSGGNGVNTVYQVGAAGSLPTLANASTAPITILPGLPTTLAKNADATNPFGIWFANATTLYVADEGDGTVANAATSPFAGLQKWSLVNGRWQLDYVLQNGLGLGQQYGLTGYPAAINPATDGIRNITGRVNANGTVTIWGVTSTVSANGDPGADPNRLVAINDILLNTSTSIAGGEQFTTVKSAGYAEVLRGVSITPGTMPVTVASNAVVIVSAANPATNTLVPNSIASAYGADLATSAQAPVLPAPLVEGGSSVSILDYAGNTTAASLLYVSPTQINFLVPGGVAAGPAQITIVSGDGTKSTAPVQIGTYSPGIFTLAGSGLAGADVFHVTPAGLQLLEQVYAINPAGMLVPNPIKGLGTDRIYIVLYGTGIRNAPKGTVQVTIGGVNVPVLYAGAQGSAAGLDQINFEVPATLAGKGVVPIQVTIGTASANQVLVTIQ